jgi:lipopolysaccharide transport system permease protein
MQEEQKEQWTEIITARKSWFDLHLEELWRYRDLVLLFVWRDFVSIYKQTILGPLWHIIQPLLTTLVFTVVFGAFANIPTGSDEIPHFLFYLCGITIWNYFATCLTKTSTTFVSNAQIFGKVYFPRLTVPVATVISGLFSFGIQLALFFIFWVSYWIGGTNLQISAWILLIPYLVFLMALLGLGLGIIVSSLTTKYRDLVHLVTFGVQLAMYATPVIYPLSIIKSETARYVLLLNPITPLVEGFRLGLLGSGTFDVYLLIYSTLFTVSIFLIGVAMFHRVEKTFMDTI